MSSPSTGDVTTSSISSGLEASKKSSSSSDSPEETNIAGGDLSRIMGGAETGEDLSKLVLKEPVKFQGKYSGIYKLQLSPGTRIGLVSDFFLNLGKVFAKLCNALF